MHFVDMDAATRPTGYRLWIAMGVAALLLVLFVMAVAWLVNQTVITFGTEAERTMPLTVYIARKVGEPVIAPTGSENVDRPFTPGESSAETEAPLTQPETAVEERGEQPAESRSPPDWYAIANNVAKTTVADHLRRGESTAALWRRSPSIMFESQGEPQLKAETAVLADLEFIPRVRVLGLGVTIGSCFFGVPIAGVPVEQRQVAITLFVCADGS